LADQAEEKKIKEESYQDKIIRVKKEGYIEDRKIDEQAFEESKDKKQATEHFNAKRIKKLFEKILNSILQACHQHSTRSRVLGLNQKIEHFSKMEISP
jgi:hypothetical protein